jgi:uncharacterized protein YcfJ
MKAVTKILAAMSVVATSGVPVMAPADAHSTYYPHKHRYHGRVHYARKYCRRSSATTGTVVGGVGGALVGRSLLGHGLLGTAAGAVGGAVAGGAIDRSMTAHRRCYYR